jgi:peptidylprolyl isomerase
VTGIAPIPTADLSPAGAFGTRPTVTVPSGSPPSQLEAWDLIVGSGATATAGETVNVQYDGYSWTNKKEFDASWNRGQAFSFPLGEGQVIKGWDEGVVGMKVGGRRELIIPPSLGYGAQSPTSAIAPNDTLIFVVDLVSIGS